jgi:short-subunit dehydrogenase
MEATNTSPSSLKKTFDINFFMPVTLYLYLRKRAPRRAYFVFVGSSSGIMGLPRFSAYSSTKSSLATYFFSVVCESPQDNVNILGVIPSGMKTNFQKNNGVPSSPLDKFLLADPSRVASQMIKWMGKGKRKSKIQHVGISAVLFLVIRNLSFGIKTSIVKKLSEGSR